jgi:hypothetical protein
MAMDTAMATAADALTAPAIAATPPDTVATAPAIAATPPVMAATALETRTMTTDFQHFS